MTTSPDTDPVAALDRLAAHYHEPHPAELRCGTAIRDWLRSYATTHPTTAAGPAAALLGLRVIVDDRLDPGEWRVYDQHGQQMHQARVGEPGDHVAHWPGIGFVTINLPAGTPGATS